MPPPFHEHPELEISRRIERGSGSAYRVNGREVRARDVQTLFADLASGARASGMVSQGRVGALVGARPEDRRAVLEEAAGITGLHARRHEAELKLRAAEANLARAEDLRGQLEAQLAGSEAPGAAGQPLPQYLRRDPRGRGGAAGDPARAGRGGARGGAGGAAEAGMAVAAATEAARPPRARHRSCRGAAAAAGQRKRRRARRWNAIASRRSRSPREEAAPAQRWPMRSGGWRCLRATWRMPNNCARDAAAAEQRLEAEAAGLARGGCRPRHAGRDRGGGVLPRRRRRCVWPRLRRTVRPRPPRRPMHGRRPPRSFWRRPSSGRGGWASNSRRSAGANEPRAAQQVDPARLDEAQREQAAAEAALAELARRVEQVEQVRGSGNDGARGRPRAQSAADSARAKLAAEAQALAEVLAVKDGERWPPMVDALVVPDGLETALGAALGEELTSAPIRMRRGTGGNCRRLIHRLRCRRGPRRWRHWCRGLRRWRGRCRRSAWSMTMRLARHTSPIWRRGRYWSRGAGAIWRWDGYTIHAGTPTQAAVRLQQRNRLAALRERLAAAEQTAVAARARVTRRTLRRRTPLPREQRCRAARREAEQRVLRAVAAATQLRNQAEAARGATGAAEQQIARLSADRDEVEAALARAREAHEALPDLATLRQAVDSARAALTRCSVPRAGGSHR